MPWVALEKGEKDLLRVKKGVEKGGQAVRVASISAFEKNFSSSIGKNNAENAGDHLFFQNDAFSAALPAHFAAHPRLKVKGPDDVYWRSFVDIFEVLCAALFWE